MPADALPGLHQIEADPGSFGATGLTGHAHLSAVRQQARVLSALLRNPCPPWGKRASGHALPGLVSLRSLGKVVTGTPEWWTDTGRTWMETLVFPFPPFLLLVSRNLIFR